MATHNTNIVYDYGISRVVTAGLEVIVQIKAGNGWKDVRSFNRMSDDYAFTNARDEALYRAARSARPDSGN